MDDADVDLAVRASVFGAVGTCGQRCTSLRRLVSQSLQSNVSEGAFHLCCTVPMLMVQIVHESVYDDVVRRMITAYKSVRCGDPLAPGAFARTVTLLPLTL